MHDRVNKRINAGELLNEPRLGGDYEKTRGIPPGTILCDWVAEMSQLIK